MGLSARERRGGLSALSLAALTLIGCEGPSIRSTRAAWLSAWDQAVTSAGASQACPALSLPNLRSLAIGGGVLPYYAERFKLEWHLSTPEVKREEAPVTWSPEPPSLVEGLVTLSARVVALKEDAEVGPSAHGPLPSLTEGCLGRLVGQVTTQDYWVDLTHPGGVEDEERRAISANDPRVDVWATEVIAREEGEEVGPQFSSPERALGPAEGDPLRALSLGEGGSVTVALSASITERAGPELVVFENSFNDRFLELAWVEVSSNGVDFARLPSQHLGDQPLGPFGEQDPELTLGLAGSTRAGWSPGFDLFSLEGHPMVVTGRVALDSIRFVRVVDIQGDGRALDSGGRPIFDPYPTIGSAGFDLDGVGALSASSH